MKRCLPNAEVGLHRLTWDMNGVYRRYETSVPGYLSIPFAFLSEFSSSRASAILLHPDRFREFSKSEPRVVCIL